MVDVDPANTRSWRLLERLRFSLVWEGGSSRLTRSTPAPPYVYVLVRPTDPSIHARWAGSPSVTGTTTHSGTS